MRDYLRRLFYGRYGAQGTDALTRFFLRVAIVLMILSLLLEPLSFLYYGTILLLVMCYFRLFSKNISKRTKENETYRKLIRKIKGIFSRKYR